MRLNYATRMLEFYDSLGWCHPVCMEMGLRIAEDMAIASNWLAEPGNSGHDPGKCEDLLQRKVPAPADCQVCAQGMSLCAAAISVE